MSSSFADEFDQYGDDSTPASEVQPFDDGFLDTDFFYNFDSTAADSTSPIYVSGGEFPSDLAYFSSETNVDGPILPQPEEIGPEEGYAVREWRRQNVIRLEEKEKREKELLSQIIVEADDYKIEFHMKSQLTTETNRATNREKEKIFVASQEKFHVEADKDYWKSIAELIPPKTEKRKGKTASSVVVVEGPKPGKPTDLGRMRQILLKLQHDTPPHLKPSPPPASAPAVA